MTTHMAPSVTALQAQATANLFLSNHLPDRFTADQPWFDPQGACWHVSVILAYPGVGVLGTVGDMQVATQTATVVAYTPCEVMRHTAQDLYSAHRDAIDTTAVSAC
jgi:hypothetical protein